MNLNIRFVIKPLYTLLVLLIFSACSSSEKTVQDTALEAFKRGNQSMKSGSYRAALKEYNFAIELDDSQAAFFYNRGLAEFELKLFKEAEVSFVAASKLDKGMSEAWYNLALVYERMGDSERAYIAYDRYQKSLKK